MTVLPGNRMTQRLAHVHQGEFRVSADPREVLTTVLGSCVACCLFDPDTAVGGMNHFLLPSAGAGAKATLADADIRYGAHSMEVLLNALFKLGARKRCLRAKVFGGGHLEPALGPIGSRNASFALRFLADEGIPCIAQSLGGPLARRLRFVPCTGQAQQQLIPDTPAARLFTAPPRPVSPGPAADAGPGTITFFED